MRSAGLAFSLALALLGCNESAPAGSKQKSKSSGKAALLRDVSREVGLDFQHESGARGNYYLPEIMGAGVGLFDAEGDGDLDVYLTSGNDSLNPGNPPPASLNRLFLQQKDGSFADATARSGLRDEGYGMGVAVGDFDNDGLADLYLTNVGPDRLYRNLGGGSFADVTAEAGIALSHWSTSAAFLDYDRDGWLDLYVANYVEHDEHKHCTDRSGRPDYCNPKAHRPVHDSLLHNEGGDRFRDVSAQAGITAVPPCAGLGVVCCDLNGDSWIDVYVANDGYPNQYWINQRDGTFRDGAVLSGCALNANGAAEAGMGIIAADLDDDADFDLFVTHLTDETNAMYKNLGGARGFMDARLESGLGSPSRSFTGFGTVAFDLEHDGDLDIAIANGRVTHGEARADSWMDSPWNTFAQPNTLYLNQGGARFEAFVDEGEGSFTQEIEIARSLACGDLDLDGDLDLVAGNIQGPARVFRNESPKKGHWLLVRANDARYNREAIGAIVSLRLGERTLSRVLARAYSYLSSSAPEVHFGLGAEQRELARVIDVQWPDGLRERFEIPGLDRVLTLVRGEGEGLP